MNSIAGLFLTQNLIKLSRKYREHSKGYENRAIAILHTSYEIDKEAKYCLVRNLPKWNDRTLLQLAYSGKHMDFVEDDCCQAILGTIWYGKISTSTPSSVLLLCIFLPFPFLNLVDFESDDAWFNGENDRLQKEIISNDDSKQRCKYFLSEYVRGKWYKFTSFYEAPVTKFITNTISFLVFLGIFSFFLTVDLHPNVPSVYEYVVWCWALTMWLDEVRQMCDVDAPNARLEIFRVFPQFLESV